MFLLGCNKGDETPYRRVLVFRPIRQGQLRVLRSRHGPRVAGARRVDMLVPVSAAAAQGPPGPTNLRE